MKCLFCKSPEDFLVTANELVDTWNVRKGTLKERYELIKDTYRYNSFLNAAKENEIEINPTEIVSWLDNMTMLYSIFKEIEIAIKENKIPNDFFENMYIIAEYHIPFNKNRIDYLIAKDDKILLIEFSYCDNEKSKDHYKRKLNQIIYYQDLLKSSLSEHIKINIFTFLIKPEESSYMDLMLTTSKHTDREVSPNWDENFYLFRLIIHTFSNTKKSAIEELNVYGDEFLYY